MSKTKKEEKKSIKEHHPCDICLGSIEDYFNEYDIVITKLHHLKPSIFNINKLMKLFKRASELSVILSYLIKKEKNKDE